MKLHFAVKVRKSRRTLFASHRYPTAFTQSCRGEERFREWLQSGGAESDDLAVAPSNSRFGCDGVVLTGRGCDRFNKYVQIAARATRQGLKEEERLKAEKRGAVSLKWQEWKAGRGGVQVSYSLPHPTLSPPHSVLFPTRTRPNHSLWRFSLLISPLPPRADLGRTSCRREVDVVITTTAKEADLWYS